MERQDVARRAFPASAMTKTLTRLRQATQEREGDAVRDAQSVNASYDNTQMPPVTNQSDSERSRRCCWKRGRGWTDACKPTVQGHRTGWRRPHQQRSDPWRSFPRRTRQALTAADRQSYSNSHRSAENGPRALRASEDKTAHPSHSNRHG